MAAADIAAMRYIRAEDKFRLKEAEHRAAGDEAEAEGAKWYAEWCHRAAVNEFELPPDKVTKPAVLCTSPHDLRLCVGGVRCTRCDYRVGSV